MFLKCQEEGEHHPSCPHGPTILFWKKGKDLDGYYACSAFRDLKDCSVKIPFSRSREIGGICEFLEYHKGKLGDKRELIGSNYCLTCNIVFKSTTSKVHASHKIHKNISLKDLNDPTKILLQPTGNDKAEAQYFFDDRTLQFLGSVIKDCQIKKIVCVGAPRVHFYSKNMLNIQTYLLDLDDRFFNFCDEAEFASFNMCNGHFLEGNRKKEIFLEFLKGDLPLIFLDPPFACRTEPIVHTLNVLAMLFREINNGTHEVLPIIWVFPYYFEHYIRNLMPEMEMCDYKMNYTNHKLFFKPGRKQKVWKSDKTLY